MNFKKSLLLGLVAMVAIVGAVGLGASTAEAADPSNIVASDGTNPNGVDVTFNGGQGNNFWFRIFRSPSSRPPSCVVGDADQIGDKYESQAATGSYTDTNAAPGVTYNYAVGRCAQFLCPTVACGTNYDFGWRPLPPPTNIIASNGTVAEHVAVTWTPDSQAPGGTRYQIGRGDSNSNAPNWPPVQDNWETSGTSWWDTSAVPGLGYKYFVRSCFILSDNSRACGTWHPSGGEPGYRLVLAPTGVAASTDQSTGITVSWFPGGGSVDQYAVQRCTSSSASSCDDFPGNVKNVAVGHSGVQSFTDTSSALVVGTNYYYRVGARGVDGHWGPWSAVSAAGRKVSGASGLTVTAASAGCQGVTPYVSASWTGRSTNTWLKISSSNSMAPYWDHFVASGSSYTSTGGTVAYSAGQAGIISPLALTAGNTYYVQVTDGSSTASNVRPVVADNCSATNTYTLTTNTAGSGSGTITKRVNGSVTSATSFAPGTIVNLTAASGSGSTWGGWGDDCSGSSLTCTLTMSESRTVIATFNSTATPGTITLTTGGNKQVEAGVSVTNTLRVDNKPGFNGQIKLLTTTLPAGMTVTPGSGYAFESGVNQIPFTMPLTIQTTAATPEGNHTLSFAAYVPGCADNSPGCETGYTTGSFVVSVVAPTGTPELPVSSCPSPGVLGWQAPSVGAPNGNPAAPVNAGLNVQYKRGCLRLGSGTEIHPTYPLEVAGNSVVTGTLVAGQVNTHTLTYQVNGGSSDARLKTNIQPLAASIRDLVLKLNPVSFDWKNTGKASLGLIAQEVEPLFPEVVGEDSRGYKTLNYQALIAPLVKTVQEQRADIEDLRRQIEALETAN